MNEHHFQCPFCWEAISMLIDTSQSHQKYTEDCEVCCNPIDLEIQIEKDAILTFRALKGNE